MEEVLVAHFELLNQNVLGGTEENYVNLPRTFGLTAGIRTGYLPNTCRKRYPFKQR
jgi:hypothetical protein